MEATKVQWSDRKAPNSWKKWQTQKFLSAILEFLKFGKWPNVRYYRTDLLHIQLVSSKMSAIVDLSAIFGVR